MAPNAQKPFQQSFNIVEMSNIHGKHVHNDKTWRYLIRGNDFLAIAASVTDIFEIIANLTFDIWHLTFVIWLLTVLEMCYFHQTF